MFRRDNLDRFFSKLEWQWSLANLVWGVGAVAFTALPAWAVRSMGMMSEYAPLSWVLSGMAGFGFFVVGFFMYSLARARVVRARYDNRAMARGGYANPMDKVFERKRVYLNEFVLPSNPHIIDKTFIDCEIVGPANIFLRAGNTLNGTLLPNIDAAVVPEGRPVFNSVEVMSCTFRRCSFQRITFLIDAREYENFKHGEILNWMSFAPDSELPLLSKATEALPEGSDAKPQGSPSEGQN